MPVYIGPSRRTVKSWQDRNGGCQRPRLPPPHPPPPRCPGRPRQSPSWQAWLGTRPPGTGSRVPFKLPVSLVLKTATKRETYRLEGRRGAPGRGPVLFLHTYLLSTILMPELQPSVRKETVLSFQMHMMVRNNTNNIILVPWEKISKSNIESGL